MSAVAMNPEVDPNQLKQLPSEQLVGLIVQQQHVIEQLQQEITRLKASLQLDSQTSSKPPSTDLLKKPEKPKETADKTGTVKRKPGGQPGHLGKTRKGFGRIDRYEILKPIECLSCGSVEFVEAPVSVQRQQVAQLVARPIEVVEYQRHTCSCVRCGQLTVQRMAMGHNRTKILPISSWRYPLTSRIDPAVGGKL